MSEEEFKDKRKAAKRKFTLALRKLDGSLSLGVDTDILKNQVDALEETYDNLLSVHLEYLDAYPQEDDMYMNEVDEKYKLSFKGYRDSCKSHDEIEKKKQAAPLLKAVDLEFKKLNDIIKAMEEDLAKDEIDVDSLTVSKQYVECGMNELVNKMSELSLLVDTSAQEEQLSELVSRTEQTKRKADVKVRKSCSDTLSNISRCKTPPIAAAVDASTLNQVNVACSLLPQDEHRTESALETSFTKTGHASNIKKIELPDFSGNRKDWPEFKSMFKHLAEAAIPSEQALAFELKRHVKAPADALIQSIFCTKKGAYDKMWQRLGEVYDDAGATITSALSKLYTLQRPGDDMKLIVSFINEVELVYAQLEELGQVNCISIRDVDAINNLLPLNMKMDWNRQFVKLSEDLKTKPFAPYMEYLEAERAAIIRVAGPSLGTKPKRTAYTGFTEQNPVMLSCAIHGNAGHSTAQCRSFKARPLKEKYDILKREKLCFKCFLRHKKDQCEETNCELCGRSHNKMLCFHPQEKSSIKEDNEEENPQAVTKTALANTAEAAAAILPIGKIKVDGTERNAMALFDSGSDTSYITFRYADKIGLKASGKTKLDVTTMGNVTTTLSTRTYTIPLRTCEGEGIEITAYGIKEITGKVSNPDSKTLETLFPKFDCKRLEREEKEVDILIGCDNFGLHPKREVLKAGRNLSIMAGKLGVCLQGSHELLIEKTQVSTNCVKTVHGRHVMHCMSKSHPLFELPETRTSTSQCLLTVKVDKVNSFIAGEEMGTAVDPKCGNCKCGKCPTLGHTYSFTEQQELDIIKQGLSYDKIKERWVVDYPWIINPEKLPNNYLACRSRLISLERSLMRDESWAKAYNLQIQDMIDRQVARKLSMEEIANWPGPVFYISHLAVISPKSSSTPIRIVFNSSQQEKGISLNNCLAKGPDTYANTVVGLLLRWRKEKIAIVGDIKKMFHSILLSDRDAHCHRFLWRNLETERNPPDTFIIQRVNMGDKPATAIAVEALKATAELSSKKWPEAAEMIQNCSYIDDLVCSVPSMTHAERLASEVNNVLSKGGFEIKCWQFSSSTTASDPSGQASSVSLLKGNSQDETAVLGVDWQPVRDVIVYHVMLNFSPKRRGKFSEPNLTADNVHVSLPSIMTRRAVLQQVMAIFDPLGLIAPYLLVAKVLLRETWQLELGWDEDMPEQMKQKWCCFFTDLFELENLKLPRALTTDGVVGKPWLILFSDGSNIAYGFAAYIRWKLKSGGYWCRLIMAKSRIAPLHKTTTPRMELNGAVLSKRGRQVIEKEMNIQFERVIHLVDSETVLHMLNKTSTRFLLYEGTRIGEIQKATNGDLSEWAWIPGQDNVADNATRGLKAKELDENSTWWNGPAFLYTEFENWSLKSPKETKEVLPGERTCLAISSNKDEFPIMIEKYNEMRKLRLITARILGVLSAKSFKGGSSSALTPGLLVKAESLLIKEAQRNMELNNHFKCLHPKSNNDGIIVVGSRMSKFNPMTLDGKEQALLPNKHPLTKMLMKEAHQQGHVGRDSTVAKFRQKYWTPHADKLAKAVKTSCQTCKKREPELLQQCMGQLPETRLTVAPPFSFTMLDLLGPFLTRGEVQKRTSGKCYFILFTDLGSRAIHLECVFGYSTDHFLLGFSRFIHIRGWPSVIYSDRGSQLVGADKELTEAWQQVDESDLIKQGAESGTKWVFGSADSPWHQGAVESLVKTVKRCLQFSVHSQRLTPAEYLSVAYEVANLVNERPIGHRPSPDSSINILTPNMLLLGRSTAKHEGASLPETGNLIKRFQLVRAVTEEFWKRWIELYVPSLVKQNKWLTPKRNLEPGDVVLVSDRSINKGTYRLAQVHQVFPGLDGKVRKVNIRYKNLGNDGTTADYKGARDVIVSRAIQRLALLVPSDLKTADQ